MREAGSNYAFFNTKKNAVLQKIIQILSISQYFCSQVIVNSLTVAVDEIHIALGKTTFMQQSENQEQKNEVENKVVFFIQ